MTKQTWIAIAAVFATWLALDWLIHGYLLMTVYEETAELWRPQGELKYGLATVVTLIHAGAFVFIFDRFFRRRTPRTGLLYGLLIGVAWGADMGYGSYAFQPIPYVLAQAWFWAAVVKGIAGGLVAGRLAGDA